MTGRGGKAFEVSNPTKRPTSRQTPASNNGSNLGFVPTQVFLSKQAPEPSGRSTTAYVRKNSKAKLPLADKAKTDASDKGTTTKQDWSPSMDGITGELPESLAFWMRRNAQRNSTNGGGSKSKFMEDFKGTENEIVDKVLYGSGRSCLPVFQELCRIKEKDEAISKVKDKDEASKVKDKDEAKSEDSDYVIV